MFLGEGRAHGKFGALKGSQKLSVAGALGPRDVCISRAW